MSWRTVIVSSHSKLDLQMGFLRIRNESSEKRVILDEIDILIIESTAVSLTAVLIAEFIERKIKVIFCDKSRNPIGEISPYHGSHDSSRRIKVQILWQNETKALVWQAIIQQKVLNQAIILDEQGHTESAIMLRNFANEVEPFDASHREGLAGKQYFFSLFGSNFTRDILCPINSALNYGYQILLSVFNREIAAEGYINELGIFHIGPFNSFNLGCDLIEPFRPLVDRVVIHENTSSNEFLFDVNIKRKLVDLLHNEIIIGDAKQTIINAAISYTRSITEALKTGNITNIRFPKI